MFLRRATTMASMSALSAFLLTSSVANALTPVTSVDASPDITVNLSGATYDDKAVAIDDYLTTTSASLGSLPHASDLDGYHLLGNGDQLLSFDVTVDLPGGVTADPEDVVLYDGGSYSVFFDGSLAGVPSGADVDSITSEIPDLVISFDTTVELGANIYDDEDLVRYTGGVFSLLFDGSAHGLAPSVDLDGAHVLPTNGHLVLSFDTSGTVGGLNFDDEDALEYDGNAWEILYDGSAEHAGWVAGDINALNVVPEPGQSATLVVGLLALAGMKARRYGRSSNQRDHVRQRRSK
jgi:hypothetical protein